MCSTHPILISSVTPNHFEAERRSISRARARVVIAAAVLAAMVILPAATWAAGRPRQSSAFARARIVVSYRAGSPGALGALSPAAGARTSREEIATEPARQAAAELPLAAGGSGARALVSRGGTL